MRSVVHYSKIRCRLALGQSRPFNNLVVMSGLPLRAEPPSVITGTPASGRPRYTSRRTRADSLASCRTWRG